ncbi:3-epi-6-deoxocathasterone 23-monooxygenase [Raphanus sativus]|nr:3-epi-6-deoxocathasterone 23-monooxygenase [Raphanus sativus]
MMYNDTFSDSKLYSQHQWTSSKRLHTLVSAFLRSPHLKERITRDIEASVGLTLTSWSQLPLVHVQDEIKKMTFEILVKLLMSNLLAKESLIKIVKKVVEERQEATIERTNSPANDAVDVL